MTPNDTFFDSIYKEVWRSLIPAGLTEVEADFLLDVCDLKTTSRVADLMCGYGRHSIALAKKGIKVLAVDNLSSYINEIRGEADSLGLPIETIHADVLSTDLPDGFDAVVCMGNSFAFFDKKKAITLLTKMSNSLKVGGKVIINSWMIAEIAIKYFREKEWLIVDGHKYLLDYRFCFAPNRIESRQTIISAEGEITELDGIDYVFTLDEMEEMFRISGLQTKALYSTPRKKPFQLGDNRIYIVAEKVSPGS